MTMEEIAVVTPPGVERTSRMVRNRVYKAFPRPKYDDEEGHDGKPFDPSEPSTPITLTSQSNNDSPATAASTASEADEDGIYSPPSLRSKGHRVNITMSSTRAASSDEQRMDYKASTPHGVSFRDEDRTTDNDLPFDQASDTVDRDTTTVSSTTEAIGTARQTATSYKQAIMSPLRNPQLSDFDDSNLSPVSTKFESIWVSSPEASPDRPMATKASTAAQEITTTTSSSHLPLFTKKHVAKMDELDERVGRFTISAPRYSDPQPWSGPLTPPSPHRPTPIPSYTNGRPIHVPARYPPTEATRPGTTATRSSPMHQYEKDVTAPPRATHYDMHDQPPASNYQSYSQPVVATSKAPSENIPHNAPNVRSKDEDTLFDFEGNEQVEEVDLDGSLGKNVKVTHKIRRRPRQRREKIVSETDDDTSVENYGTATFPATSLQERTHQAWKSRQKKNSSLRSKHDPSHPRAANQTVSFGKSNTIHHFEPTAQEKYDKQLREEEDASLDRSLDRSLNSEYTKTLESEVEDMIKDILFIGNSEKSKPGRRKFKDKPEVRRRIRQSQLALAAAAEKDQRVNAVYESNTDTLEDTLGDNSTLPSVDLEPAPQYSSAKQAKARSAVDAALNDSAHSSESFLSSQAPTRSTLLSEDRTSLLSASSVDSQTIESLQTNESFRSEKNGNDDPFAAMVGLVEGGLSVMSTALGYAFGESDTPAQQTRGRTKTRDGENSSKSVQPNDFNIFESCMGGAGQLLEGPDVSAKNKAAKNKAISTGVVDKLAEDMWYNSVIAKSVSALSPSFQDDNKNAELDQQLLLLSGGSKVSLLALHAAHSVHKLQGVEYDESIPIDMSKELKVCPMTLKLPLGIIFLENDGTSGFVL
jgi:hypothetical protein